MWVKHPENCQVEAGAKVWRQARENLRFKAFSAGKKQEINVQQIGFNQQIGFTCRPKGLVQFEYPTADQIFTCFCGQFMYYSACVGR
jgi:hypothetical protein